MSAEFDSQSREGRLAMINHIQAQFPDHQELLSEDVVRQMLEAAAWQVQPALDQAFMLVVPQSIYVPAPAPAPVAAPSAQAAGQSGEQRRQLIGQLRALFSNQLSLLDDTTVEQLLANNNWDVSDAFDQACLFVQDSLYLPSVRPGELPAPAAAAPFAAARSTPADQPVAVVQQRDIGVGQRLGEGSGADVYAGEWPVGSGQPVAVKQLKSRQAADVSDFRKEMEVMSRVQHERLVPLYAVCYEPMCMVMKLYHCSLEDLLLRDVDTSLTWARRMALVRDVAEGLAALHSSNMIHRDLKSKNVLIEYVVEDGEGVPRASLGDFGLSRPVDREGTGMTAHHDVGTLAYMAPELFAGRRSTPAADVYAFGLLMFEIAHRQYCWAKQHFSVFDLCRHQIRPLYEDEALPELPVWYVGLMTACWAENPLHRPTMAHALHLIDHHRHDQPPLLSLDSSPALALPPPIPAPALPDHSDAPPPSPLPSGFSIVSSSHLDPKLWDNARRQAHHILPFEAAAELSIYNLIVPPQPQPPAPLVGPTAEPAVLPASQPVVEPTAQPAVEPTAQPVVEPVVEPPAEPVVESLAEPAPQPVIEPTVEPTAEPVAEPVAQPAVESTVQPAEPTGEPLPEPVAEPVAEPTTEPVAEPAVNTPVAQPVGDAASSAPERPVLTGHWKEDTACHLCKARFSMVLRRHHCRNCGSSCCFRCSPTVLHLDDRSGLLKVCDECVPEIEADADRLAHALAAPLSRPLHPRTEEPFAGQGHVYSYAAVPAGQQVAVGGPLSFVIQTWGLVKQSKPRVVMQNPGNDRVVVPLAECIDIAAAQRYVRLCHLVSARHAGSPADFYAAVLGSGVLYTYTYRGVTQAV